MTGTPSDPGQQVRQNELDQQQAVADIDQGIADREQARLDREQEPLDAETEALVAGAPVAQTDGRSCATRTTDIALRQDRQDAHQSQIDQTQLAQGVRQSVIDRQQGELEQPRSSSAGDEDALVEAGEVLQQALRMRAQEALARAESSRRRAIDALRRLDASTARQVEQPRKPQPPSQRRPRSGHGADDAPSSP